MDPLLRAALRRREIEQTEGIQSVAPSEIATEARKCPVCGGPTRPGARGACVACRPVRFCECGCGRELDRRDEWAYSKWCGPTALRALAALSTPEVVQVMKLMRPVISDMKTRLEAKKVEAEAEDARQMHLFGATSCATGRPEGQADAPSDTQGRALLEGGRDA